MTLRIALVGSRALEESQYSLDAQLYYNVCTRFAELGIIMRSGNALGADKIASTAYSNAIDKGLAKTSQMEVFIATESIRYKNNVPKSNLAVVRNPSLTKRTEDLASSVHPNWKACSQWARDMHSRNCHQIFGYYLNEPVDAVVCWTKNGADIGGTRTAIVLSKNANIPVFNLGRSDKKNVLAEIKQFLKEHQVQGLH